MKIVHRYCGFMRKKIDDARRDFDEVGIEYEYDPDPFRSIIFFIAEDDPRWNVVQDIVKKYDFGSPIIYTEFTNDELNAASYLDFTSNWNNGYPMPDNDNGYLELTYDLTDYCPKCGMGLKQKAPFRIKSEPRWSGKRMFFSLFWIYDELFTRPGIWQTVFKPFGIGCKPVLKHRSDKVIESVVQLDINHISPAPLEAQDYAQQSCSYCKRIRYDIVERGYYPKLSQDVDLPMFKSQEYFGSGAAADRLIIVSAALYQEIMKQSPKAVTFRPLAQ